MSKSKTVFVGMSGGVDSSVSALRLKKQSYNVVGVFIKVWHPDFMVCNWEQERLDAMRVAAKLEIPFLTCDAKEAYRENVANYFIEEYRAGRTPNPDVMCNKEVKFGVFMEFAKAKGADYIATGHYVRRFENDGKAELHRGLDNNKDQSYFLWTLNQPQLEYSLFPIGDTEKNEVRHEAKKADLPVAEKQDSQGICFLGQVDIPEFLSHYIDLEPGPVLDESGAVIGEHKGAFVYTLGQRHGFSVTNATDNQEAQYVISRNVEANTITVSTKRPINDSKETIKLNSLVLRQSVTEGDELQVQFRYRQKPINAKIVTTTDQSIEILPLTETDKPSSGQSCVLYLDSHCIGGGIIQ